MYELAKRKKESEEAVKRNDDYRMPDSYDEGPSAQAKRYDVLTQRFRCAADMMQNAVDNHACQL